MEIKGFRRCRQRLEWVANNNEKNREERESGKNSINAKWCVYNEVLGTFICSNKEEEEWEKGMMKGKNLKYDHVFMDRKNSFTHAHIPYSYTCSMQVC